MMAHVSGNWSHRPLQPWMRSPCADTASSHGNRAEKLIVDAAACVCSLISKQYLGHHKHGRSRLVDRPLCDASQICIVVDLA